MDSLGRGALTLAIEAENLEMVELLIVMGVETKDALLHAIDQEFVEAVELLLEHEELLTSQVTENCEWKLMSSKSPQKFQKLNSQKVVRNISIVAIAKR